MKILILVIDAPLMWCARQVIQLADFIGLSRRVAILASCWSATVVVIVAFTAGYLQVPTLGPMSICAILHREFREGCDKADRLQGEALQFSLEHSPSWRLFVLGFFMGGSVVLLFIAPIYGAALSLTPLTTYLFANYHIGPKQTLRERIKALQKRLTKKRLVPSGRPAPSPT